MSKEVARRLRGEVETPRPLRAREGLVSLTGWCLAEGEATAPVMRLVAGEIILPATGRISRADLATLLPEEPAVARCGFVITGRLPAGVHVVRVEAQGPGGWDCLKTLTVAVEPRPFAAAVEFPPTGEIARQRVHVEGWALDPRQPVQQLAMRYGHQEIACDLDRPRADVPVAYPESRHATRAGFKSRTILSAGRGPLRLKARLADGSTALARTELHIDVATDEHHDARINFGAQRLALPRPAATSRPAAPVRAARPLNLLFILPGSFASNSALHVSALANELAGAGHTCTVAVSHDVETLAHHASPAFRGVSHVNADKDATFPDGRGPDLIHAWTTRENVRRLAEKFRARHRVRLVVHLEDNEQEILALSLGRPAAELDRMSDDDLARLVPADLSHPRHGRHFLAGADAVTVITEKLRELVPADRTVHTIQPAADERYFHRAALPAAFRRVLDRTPGEIVLCYHGNVHASNAAEVRALYAAVLQLNRAGEPVTLIRTGLDRVDFLEGIAAEVAPHVLSLGQILHHRHLPALLSLANIFVQPGEPDAFNDYRFPSKLPEFFALGRPVVLPRTNLGAQVRHGIDAYVLDRADAVGIAAAITALRRDPALAARLSEGAAAFAAKYFSWRRSAESLTDFYRSIVAG